MSRNKTVPKEAEATGFLVAEGMGAFGERRPTNCWRPLGMWLPNALPRALP